VLHADGCKNQAKVALQCCLNISPTDENLLDSWQELAVDPVGKYHHECLMIRFY